MYNLGDLKQTILAASAAVTATGNTSGVTLSSEPLGTLLVVFDVVNTAGTTPTYSAQVQSSPDGTTWTNVGPALAGTTTNTGTGKVSIDAKSLTGLQLRIAETIGGSASPSYTRSAQLITRQQVFP